VGSGLVFLSYSGSGKLIRLLLLRDCAGYSDWRFGLSGCLVVVQAVTSRNCVESALPLLSQTTPSPSLCRALFGVMSWVKMVENGYKWSVLGYFGFYWVGLILFQLDGFC
jgi:hypothetical protein